jgi:diguanylate cyclase (GGDEF)-like protein
MKKVVIISRDVVFANLADRLLSRDCEIVAFTHIQPALDYIYNATPTLVVLEIHPDDAGTVRILSALKVDPMFSFLPVLAVLAEQPPPAVWDSLLIEDFIWKTDLEKDLLGKVKLCILRAERVVETNPLTRLPGNISIDRQIRDRLDRGEPFALAYADLDHFKPFNDKYGFSRGDDVIKITGRIILNMVKIRQPEGSFIGHIGGDDFIFIMDRTAVEAAAREIIDAFEQIIPTFYDPEDRRKASIQSYDRQGNVKIYPMMSISIGITDTDARHFTHYGEMTEAASEMKKFAKQFSGSCYRLDKRHGADKGLPADDAMEEESRMN